MEWVKKKDHLEQCIKESFKMVKFMGTVHLNGQIKHHILVK